MRSVSPMRGLICNVTLWHHTWPLAITSNPTTRDSQKTGIGSSESVWIVRRSGSDDGCRRARHGLRGNEGSQLREKKLSHVPWTLADGGVAGADDLVLLPNAARILHPTQRDR